LRLNVNYPFLALFQSGIAVANRASWQRATPIIVKHVQAANFFRRIAMA
jgi:hypothetical protein